MSSGAGFAEIVVGGILAGLFTTPLHFMPRWKWENAWLLFTVYGMLLFPWLLVGATHLDIAAAYEGISTATFVGVVLLGVGWGFGAVLFGLSTHVVGNSLGFSIHLGMTSTLGSLIPLLVFHIDEIGRPTGIYHLVSLCITFFGVSFLGYAGSLKDAEQARRKLRVAGSHGDGGEAAGEGTRLITLVPTGSAAEHASLVPGPPAGSSTASTTRRDRNDDDVEVGGEPEPTKASEHGDGSGGPPMSFTVGMIVCVLSGVLSPMLNVSLAFGDPIKKNAEAAGAEKEDANSAVWVLGVGGGALVNLTYASYLLFRNRAWRLFLGRPVRRLRTLRGPKKRGSSWWARWGLGSSASRHQQNTALSAPAQEMKEEVRGEQEQEEVQEEEEQEEDASFDDEAEAERVDARPLPWYYATLRGPRALLAWIYPAVMGAVWFFGTSMYGSGASKLGELGTTIGWPIYITCMILTGNVSGVLSGEWKGSELRSRLWMGAGIAMLVASIIVNAVGSGKD